MSGRAWRWLALVYVLAVWLFVYWLVYWYLPEATLSELRRFEAEQSTQYEARP